MSQPQRATNNPQQQSSSSRMRRIQLLLTMAALIVSGAHGFSLPSLVKRQTSQTTTTNLAVMEETKQASEFELQLGRALDTLRHDYPDMLTTRPDYSIYDQDIVVVDPSGFTLNGISNYKQSFKLVHAIVSVFYCPEKSLLTFRLVYDAAHNHIRVSWNAEVVPKKLFGGTKTTLHVDGISVYELSGEGKVVQHRVEHLMINDRPVAPEKGIFFALREECADPNCIPSFIRIDNDAELSTVVEFQSSSPFSQHSLVDSQNEALQVLSTSTDGGESNKYPGLDWEAFDKKNKTRKKFGLKALSPEEFLEIEDQVQQMAAIQQQKQQNAEAVVPAKKTKKATFLDNIFGEMVQNTCESNFDCKRPQVCCDFGVKKMCCSSGAMVGQMQGQMQPVRIPITKDDGYTNGY